MTAIQDLLELIKASAREAAELALSFYDRGFQVYQKEGGSPVTEADIEVGRFLKRRLMADLPDYGWLSEEEPPDNSHILCHRAFIIDPIDGTRAFISKIPDWTISIALVQDGQPLAGVIYNPMHDKMYMAAKGQAATVNGNQLSQSQTDTDAGNNDKSLYIYSDRNHLCYFSDFNIVQLPRVASLAYKMALVAEGQAEAAFIKRCHIWDVAAADIILSASGKGLLCLPELGKIDYKGSVKLPGMLLAADSKSALAAAVSKRITATPT